MNTESQHIDAMVRVMDDPYVWVGTTDEAGDDLFVDGVIGLDDSRKIAQTILDSTDPAVHAAMLDALTRHGVLERVPVCHEPGFTQLVQVDWQEVADQ